MTVRAPAWETWLRFGVLAGIGLLLLTPFVVSTGTIFPFVVGKAVWSRSVIAVVFALWAVLALANPSCRPPRSRVLVVLAAGLAVSLLAACFGASFQRSLWSSYERMQGVVDGAHWMALAVVLVSVLRTGAAWRRLLTASAGAGAAMACLVIARHYDMDVPFYGALPEQHLPRLSGPLGNPIYLSAYLLANLMLALGLAVRAWLTPAPPATPAAAPKAPAAAPKTRAGRRRRAKRREKAPAQRGARPAPGRLAGLAGRAPRRSSSGGWRSPARSAGSRACSPASSSSPSPPRSWHGGVRAGSRRARWRRSRSWPSGPVSVSFTPTARR